MKMAGYIEILFYNHLRYDLKMYGNQRLQRTQII